MIKNVMFQAGHKSVDTEASRFGVVVGNNSAIGTAVIILPGREVPSNSVIQAGTVVGKKYSQLQSMWKVMLYRES